MEHLRIQFGTKDGIWNQCSGFLGKPEFGNFRNLPVPRVQCSEFWFVFSTFFNPVQGAVVGARRTRRLAGFWGFGVTALRCIFSLYLYLYLYRLRPFFFFLSLHLSISATWMQFEIEFPTARTRLSYGYTMIRITNNDIVPPSCFSRREFSTRIGWHACSP